MTNIWGRGQLLLAYNQMLKIVINSEYIRNKMRMNTIIRMSQRIVKWLFPFNLSTLALLIRASHTLRSDKKATN